MLLICNCIIQSWYWFLSDHSTNYGLWCHRHPSAILMKRIFDFEQEMMVWTRLASNFRAIFRLKSQHVDDGFDPFQWQYIKLEVLKCLLLGWFVSIAGLYRPNDRRQCWLFWGQNSDVPRWARSKNEFSTEPLRENRPTLTSISQWILVQIT